MNLDKLPAYPSALLLQGPVGPFFWHLAGFLRQRGSEVYKINFNLGDDLFYRKGALRFDGRPEVFAEYLNSVLDVTGAAAIFLFGDCRPMHQVAMKVAALRGVDVWVFEEGYIRPGYITMELGGTNNHSGIPRALDFYVERGSETAESEAAPVVIKNGFWKMAGYAFAYFAAGFFGRWRYPFYQHHKPMHLSQGFYWARSFLRKHLYQPWDAVILKRLLGTHAGNYFLVPLQVFNDASVTTHSQYSGVSEFIAEVIASFAHHAPRDMLLVLKHHPMDRGYVNYANVIKSVARQHGVLHRIRYIHGGHVPTLIRASRGVVLINSTVGLQALYHRTRVKVMGMALYDVPGLTFAGSLDEFWLTRFRPDRAIAARFRRALISMTQVAGNFYDRAWCRQMSDLAPSGLAALVWRRKKLLANNNHIQPIARHAHDAESTRC